MKQTRPVLRFSSLAAGCGESIMPVTHDLRRVLVATDIGFQPERQDEFPSGGMFAVWMH